MLFTISMWALVAVSVIWVLSVIAIIFSYLDVEDKFIGSVASLFPMAVAAFFPALFFFGTWGEHASDISKIQSQDEIIRVQRDRAQRLTDRLSSFEYPSGALLNADTPVGAIVSELGKAEAALAEAEAERAIAIRSVEARRIGPLSNVIDFVGDYK